MFRHDFVLRSKPRLLLGLVILMSVLLWWGRTRQHALDRRPIRAVRNGELAAVEARLQEGANPNAVEDPSPSSLSFWQQLWRLIRNQNPRVNVLEIAVANRRWRVAERLIEEGATVTRSGETTALKLAASGGAVEVVEYLLRNGARINVPDPGGRTPLYHAVAAGHPGVVEKLLEKGATIAEVNRPAGAQIPDVSALTRLGLSMLPIERRAAVLTMLLGKGLDIDTPLESGQTMLTQAMLRRDLPLATFLVEHGADFDLQDRNGDTARFHAKRLFIEARGRVTPEFVELIEIREP